MTTISSDQGGLTLSSPAYTDPVSIEEGVTIVGLQDGIYASSGSWTVDNAGFIYNNFGNDGIELASGYVYNESSALILSDYSGIKIAGSATVINAGTVEGDTARGVDLGTGTIWNQESGTILGSLVGAYLSGSGTIVNDGLIGGNEAVYFGATGTHVLAFDGEAQFSGLVVGNADATNIIELTGGAGQGTLAGFGTTVSGFQQVTVESGANWVFASGDTFDPSGTLTILGTATNYSSIDSTVSMGSGATLTNAASATIAANGDAIGATWDVIENDGRLVSVLEYGVYVRGASTITNRAGASITGYRGGIFAGSILFPEAEPDTVLNAGLISASSGAGIGVVLVTGGYVSNASTGVITGAGTGDGVAANYLPATLFNAGRISGTAADGVELSAGGTITNAATGTISGSTGIRIGAGLGEPATVLNAGSVHGGATGQSGIYVSGDGHVSNASGGAISGAKYGVLVAAGASTVVNAGSILGGSTADVRLLSGGSVTNSAGGQLGGQSGILLAGAASVSNAGTIDVFDSAVYAGLTGLSLGSAVLTLSNSGLIEETGATPSGAVLAHDGGLVSNASTGTILAASNAVSALYGVGTIDNAGLIESLDENGVSLKAGGAVSNAATGTILGGSYAIDVRGAATILNAGRVVGGLSSAALYLHGTATVSNVVGGYVAGGYEGIEAQSTLSMTNAGIIHGGGHAAINVAVGRLTNAATGVISGGSFGISA